MKDIEKSVYFNEYTKIEMQRNKENIKQQLIKSINKNRKNKRKSKKKTKKEENQCKMQKTNIQKNEYRMKTEYRHKRNETGVEMAGGSPAFQSRFKYENEENRGVLMLQQV